MNPYAALGAVLLWGASLGATGWWFYGAGRDAEVASQDRAEKAVQAASEKMTAAAAQAISQIKVQHRTVQQEIQREVVEKPVFRDCRSGPDAVRLLNSTIPGYKPEREGSGVPTSDTPH